MSQIAAEDWMEHHSGRIAQDCAVRLAAASHTVWPSDTNLRGLVAEQIKADLMDFAFHTRKLMERTNSKNSVLGHDPLWPPSTQAPPMQSLWQLLGTIVHANSIEVCWEKADLEPSPYEGRAPQFASSIEVTSDKGAEKLPIGSMVSAFFGSLLNQFDIKTERDRTGA